MSAFSTTVRHMRARAKRQSLMFACECLDREACEAATVAEWTTPAVAIDQTGPWAWMETGADAMETEVAPTADTAGNKRSLSSETGRETTDARDEGERRPRRLS